MALNYAYIRDSEVLNTLRVDFYKDGGAVWMDDGVCTISGGAIYASGPGATINCYDGMVFNYDKDLTLTAQWRL